MFNIRFTLLTACLFACVASLRASHLDSLLTEVQVVASKYPTKLSQTGKVVSIISSEQIQSSAGKNLGELLQETVGISIVGARSAPGSNQEVYVRGANTGNVLILIDGFPANDPSHISSVMDWNLMDLGTLERIEILKGGQSTLYGSDAMAGVINLVTRKSGSSIQLQGGGLGTHSESLQFQRLWKGFKFGLALKNYQTLGFSAADKQVEKDGMGQQNIRFFVGKNLSTHSDIDFSYQSEFYQADLDAGPFVDDRDYRVLSSNHAFRAQFHQQFVRGDLFLRLFQDITHRFFRNDSTDIPSNAWSNYSESAYVGLNQGAEVYVKWKLPAGMQGIMGTELRRMSTNQSDFSVSSYGRYDSPAIAADMAKVQILGNYFTLEKHQTDRWGIELGGRWNVHSLYGNNFTYHLNPYIYLFPNGKLFANYYSSFKAPSLYQLYSPYGNQDLLAEQGKTAELGYEQKWGALNTRVVVFQQDVQDGIVFQSGLSWITILRKREHFRQAFAHFDVKTLSQWDDKQLAQCLENPLIIRNRLKINAVRANAQAFIQIQEKFGSFDRFIWEYVNHHPITNHIHEHVDLPAQTDLSERMSRDLKKRGFKFVGPTICYSFMQAAGLVNDHLTSCFCYKK